MAVGNTAIWRVRPSGNNLNGGGYDPSLSGAATDYSQQNAAQASGSNATCTTGTSTFVDATANAFTSAMVGNAIQIASGTNFIAGLYFVTAFTSASTVTLDRTPVTGSNGTAGVWRLGGGWADFWTNTSTSFNQIVPGNIVYILGSGIPNPSSYVYDYTYTGAGSLTSVLGGDTTNGYIVYANDPSTPSYKAAPDTTGGMPVVKTDGVFLSSGGNFLKFIGIWTAMSNNLGTGTHAVYQTNVSMFYGCVHDHLGFPTEWMSGQPIAIACESFSSTGTGSTNFGLFIMEQGNTGMTAIGCNFHDIKISGIYVFAGNTFIANNIICNCQQGIQVDTGGLTVIINNTVDGCASNTLTVNTTAEVSGTIMLNNIASNSSAAGLRMSAGATATNDRVKRLIDYNVFYNNSVNYQSISAGAHDTALGVSPYVNSATENYALA